MEGVHPHAIAYIRKQLEDVGAAGQMDDLVAALGPDADSRLATFLEMAKDPVMTAQAGNLDRAARFEQAMARLEQRVPGAMRPSQTPEMVRTTMGPGEKPSKLVDRAIDDRDASIDQERFAPGQPLVTQDSVKAQTGVENTGDLPLGVNADTDRPRQPRESRKAGERAAGGSAADEAAVEKWYAAKAYQDAVSSGNEDAVQDAAAHMIELGMDPEKPFDFSRQVPYISDSRLNRPGAQESYDAHIQTLAGQRTKPQSNLNRANAGADADQQAVLADDVASTLGKEGEGMDSSNFANDDMIQHGPVAKKNLGGRPQPSRRMGAIDSLFTRDGLVVNPFDLEEFRGNPQDLAKKVLGSSFVNHDYDSDLARLSTQIAQEMDTHGASPTAIAEHMLQTNTFYKPNTPAWDMARDEIAKALVERFNGRTATPETAPASSLEPVRSKSPDAEAIAITADDPARKAREDSLWEARGKGNEDDVAAILEGDDLPSPDDNLEASAIDLGDDEIPVESIEAPKPKRGGRRKKGAEAAADEGVTDPGGEVDIDVASIETPTAKPKRGGRRKKGGSEQIDIENITAPSPGAAPAPSPGGAGASPPGGSPPGGGSPPMGGKGGPAKQPQWPNMKGGSKKGGGSPPNGPGGPNTPNGQNAPTPPKRPGWLSLRNLLIGAGVVGGGMALNNATKPTGMRLPPGMSGGTDGEGTSGRDVSQDVGVPPEAGGGSVGGEGQSGGAASSAADRERLLNLVGRIRGGTLGRMPMMQTMQEYY
jgi:hypothetical protein